MPQKRNLHSSNLLILWGSLTSNLGLAGFRLEACVPASRGSPLVESILIAATAAMPPSPLSNAISAAGIANERRSRRRAPCGGGQGGREGGRATEGRKNKSRATDGLTGGRCTYICRTPVVVVLVVMYVQSFQKARHSAPMRAERGATILPNYRYRPAFFDGGRSPSVA